MPIHQHTDSKDPFYKCTLPGLEAGFGGWGVLIVFGGLLTPRRHLPLLPRSRLLFNIVRRKTTNDSPAPWGMCHPFQEFCIKEKEVNMKEKKDKWRWAMGDGDIHNAAEDSGPAGDSY